MVLTFSFNALTTCDVFLQSIVGYFFSFPFGPSFFSSNLSLNHTFRVEMFLFKINEPFSVKPLVKDFSKILLLIPIHFRKRKSLFSKEIIF